MSNTVKKEQDPRAAVDEKEIDRRDRQKKEQRKRDARQHLFQPDLHRP